MSISTNTLTVLSSTLEAGDTLTLRCQKPMGFTFSAGQYVVLTVPTTMYSDVRAGRRSLSIASAPYEDVLVFIMRPSDSGFKKTVANLRPGDTITAVGPLGHMGLPPQDDYRPLVWIVGGVGITPALSMIAQALYEKRQNPLILLYANKNLETTACKKQVDDFFSRGVRGSYVFTDCAELIDGDSCSVYGKLTTETIFSHIPDSATSRFFLVGTGGFVHFVEGVLLSNGIDKNAIMMDNFG